MTKEAWSRREFAALAASGALGGAVRPSPTRWAEPFAGSSVIAPPPGPSGAELQQAFDAVQATQANAKMLQRWGSTVPMPVTNGAPLPTAPQQLISLGPFREPRALSFEQLLICNDGQSQGELDPGFTPAINLLYTVTVGIGTASVTYQYSKLPPVLYAQSLTVSVQRNDNTIFGYQLSVWAQPYAPRGTPQVFSESIVRFAAASPSAVIGGPPNFATHVQMGMPPDDAVDCLYFISFSVFPAPQQIAPPSPTATLRYLLAQKFGATPASQWLPSQMVPLPANYAGSVILSRTSSASQFDVVLQWLRC